MIESKNIFRSNDDIKGREGRWEANIEVVGVCDRVKQNGRRCSQPPGLEETVLSKSRIVLFISPVTSQYACHGG